MACALGIEQDYKECGLCGNSPTWRCKMANCKYPNEVCANMTVYYGMAYCDSVPCSLKDELSKRTNYEKIKGMSVEELAEFISEITDNCSSEMACNQFCHDDSCPGYCEFESCKEWLESECDVE